MMTLLQQLNLLHMLVIFVLQVGNGLTIDEDFAFHFLHVKRFAFHVLEQFVALGNNCLVHAIGHKRTIFIRLYGGQLGLCTLQLLFQ